ncbi:hypothetical protein [Streptomyces sp. NPDC005573]|uniref:hypothetical protein n=1 Tax=unclassified Streptomyces TaxID=2593676 RepID=UPI0033A8926E
MNRWIVLALPVGGVSEGDDDARTLVEIQGTAEEAQAALTHAVNTLDGRVRRARRREIFRCSDRSYFVRLHFRTVTQEFLVQLGELVHDSASLPQAQPYL